ncbi:MAG TPA: adenosine deaminase [Acidimicrobiales bacterium]|nr:adenosine deaminase [Acidimicrobiales bacterium]
MDDFIFGLPKCELHVHLEGTLEPEMAQAFAARHGVDTGSADLRDRPGTFAGLPDFLAAYYAAMRGLQAEADFYELTSAYLERARRQGVVYAEMFFDPQAHTARGVAFDAVVSGINRAQRDARECGGPDSALVMCFLRDEPVESAADTLASSLPYRERGWILGVGLDSDERGHPPAAFADVFADARAAGYHLTMHCDPCQEGSIDHLRQCLDLIGVERIDHGLECLSDPALTEEIARRRIGLTACPLSNLRLYGTLMADAVTELMARGVLVTLNSDDPAYFGGYIAENFEAVQEEVGLSRAELARLAKHAFEVSWLTPRRKGAYLSAVDDWAAASASRAAGARSYKAFKPGTG